MPNWMKLHSPAIAKSAHIHDLISITNMHADSYTSAGIRNIP